MTVKIFSPAFPENYGKAEVPVDHFMAGMLSGVFSRITGLESECREVRCVSRGDPFCEFRVKAKV